MRIGKVRSCPICDHFNNAGFVNKTDHQIDDHTICDQKFKKYD